MAIWDYELSKKGKKAAAILLIPTLLLVIGIGIFRILQWPSVLDYTETNHYYFIVNALKETGLEKDDFNVTVVRHDPKEYGDSWDYHVEFTDEPGVIYEYDLENRIIGQPL